MIEALKSRSAKMISPPAMISPLAASQGAATVIIQAPLEPAPGLS